MKNTITIKVSKEDIANGLPNSRRWCPIAKACFRAGNKDITVDTTFVQMNLKIYKPKTYRDLIKMVRFVKNFDAVYLRRYCRPTTINFVEK